MTGVSSSVVTHVRPDSSKLFLLFTGNREALGYPPMEFVKKTGIGGANFAVFRDPYKAGYQRGISEQYDSLDGLVAWIGIMLAEQFPHVKEVFCIGNSGGGTPALYAGYHLEVDSVWSLAGLVSNPAVTEERTRGKVALRKKFLGRETLDRLTAPEILRLKQAEKDPELIRWKLEVDENPDKCLDRALIGRLVELLKQPRRTQFHFYYATSNALDRLVAESFSDCPKVTLHPVRPPWGDGPGPEWSRLVSGAPDHNIVGLLDALGQLTSVFANVK